MIVWRLKPGLEKKFRLGHPWTFSNELAHSPKGVEPGALVELRDGADRFLAFGYGHPNSLISFRVLSRERSDAEIDADFLHRKLRRALELRARAGLARWSFRLCFAEADELPGLVVDRFVLAGADDGREAAPRGQAFVMQASTAGMDRLKPMIREALLRLAAEHPALAPRPAESSRPLWIVDGDDSSGRKLEGLAIAPKRAVVVPTGFSEADLASERILLEPAGEGGEAIAMRADLITGQKTGFFLDQRSNVKLAAEFLRSGLSGLGRPLRILDLCCYVGQWSTQLAAAARNAGLEAEATLVDSSERALEFAEANARAQSAAVVVHRMDVLESLRRLPERAYDVVVCDPPAFVKKKKDLPAGQAAYAKLNRDALGRLAPGGLFVSCSCSGLLSEEEFRSGLARASSANTDLGLRFVARGTHAPDHPQLPEFQQGTYLKCWIGFATAPARAAGGNG